MLHAAFKKETVRDGGAETSFADVDIIRLVQDCGIRTALLDEPHHLDGRLMDSLESFLGVLGGEIRVVTLTGNPPYDLHRDEWERYVNLCGEVTAEIHVPDLVKSRALCPIRITCTSIILPRKSLMVYADTVSAWMRPWRRL
jgi:hypothetical protein